MSKQFCKKGYNCELPTYIIEIYTYMLYEVSQKIVFSSYEWLSIHVQNCFRSFIKEFVEEVKIARLSPDQERLGRDNGDGGEHVHHNHMKIINFPDDFCRRKLFKMIQEINTNAFETIKLKFRIGIM